MSRAEFVMLVAMIFSIVALSMDAMLPALPQIAAELSPADPRRAPLVLTTFFAGLGVGTFIAGPLSDALGRKLLMLAGALVFISGCALAWRAETLEMTLAARALQGFGAAGPRVVALAVTRDLFAGREMARIVSFTMMVFALVPGFAPALGEAIVRFLHWRDIYIGFIAFSVVSTAWMLIRLPETLPPERRRPLRASAMASALAEVVRHPVVRLSITVQCLAMSMLIAMLMLVQQIYEGIYARGDSFALWFGAAALVASSASWINAMLVVRFGMRRIVTVALAIQIAVSALILALDLTSLSEPLGFSIFLGWQIGVFLQAGLTLGNLNAIGMEPMGHIAGMAASIIGGVSTVVAAGLAAPVAIFYDGTVTPLLLFILGIASLAFVLMLAMARVEARSLARVAQVQTTET